MNEVSKPPGLRALHKALADPLRIEMLELAWARPRSAREMAPILHRPADRLYHHLGRLVAAGLLAVVEYRPLPGGKVERVYGPARSEPPGDDASPQELARFLGAVLEATRVDVDAACRARAGGATREMALTRASLRLSREGLAAFRADLEGVLARARARDDQGPYVRVVWALVDLQDRDGTPASG